MRKRTMSACLVLAWCLLAITAVAGTRGPDRPAQPSLGHAAISSTAAGTAETITAAPAARSLAAAATVTGEAAAPAATVTATTEVTAPAAVTEVTAAQSAATWTVRPGDTLSGIAADLGVPGGWPALYAANKAAIGPDPGLIRPGAVLALPGAGRPARYTVAPGDSLSAVAAALGVPGGWPALYAANERVIGPDPDLISAGTVLAVPSPAAPAAAHPAPHRQAPQAPAPANPPRQTAPAPVGSHPARQAPAPAGRQPASHPAPRPPAPAARRPVSRPTAAGPATAPANRAAPGHLPVPAGGMPRWLQDVLLAAGVLAATAFIAEPAAALARRRRGTGGTGGTGRTDGTARPGRTRRARPRAPGTAGTAGGLVALGLGAVRGARDARGARRAARKARIVFADHERLIVTYCAADHAVYVLTPPGEDPRAVLRAARLVLPEDTYEDLAGHLGLSSAWPLE